MVTAFSAINYTAFSGEVFSQGLYVALAVPVFVFVAFPITRIVMPFFHSMRLVSAYDYLERRFDIRVRCLASGIFIVWRLLWMATALFVPCKVLSDITGWNLYGLMLMGGAAAIVYTVAGGMRAVMWTDVAQFFVLFGGLALALFVASARTRGGLAGIFQSAAEGGLLRPFYPYDPAMLSPDPRIRITLWSAWIGTFTAFLARYGADQAILQRYFSARSLRDAQRGFWLSVAAAIFSLACLAVLGFAMHAAFLDSGSAPAVPPIEFFARFVREMPFGICGLLVAGLFAATMSSIDSGINSCSAAFMNDFYQPISRRSMSATVAEAGLDEDESEAELLSLSRWLALGFGALAMGMASYIILLEQSIFEIANRIINASGSPLLALFLIAMFSRRANSLGVLIGGILGFAWSVGVSLTVENLALHYYAVVNLAGTLALCWMASAIVGMWTEKPPAEKIAWTWWERRK